MSPPEKYYKSKLEQSGQVQQFGKNTLPMEFDKLLKLINRNGENSSALEIDSTFYRIYVLRNERMQLLNVVSIGGNFHVSKPTHELFGGINLV